MEQNQINKQRDEILVEFANIGFLGETAFCNACVNADTTLSGFDLQQYYKGQKVTAYLNNRLYAILDFLKYE